MTGRTARRRIMHIDVPAPGAGETLLAHRPDLLAAEDPLEIRVDGRPLAVTMRTPGDDIDLAAGFLAGEGLVRSACDIASIRICRESHDHHAGAGRDGAGSRGADQGNVAEVTLAAGAQIDDGQVRRNFLTTSACGVCGKASIEAIRVRARYDVAADQARIDPRVLTRLPGRLHDAQRVFARTGGLHAAAAFGADGTLLALREDVGRHNAVDKVVGWALREGRLPLAGCILLVSGRASFELVQKALVAGMPIVAAVSAPSSLAAELADEAGMTLVGFLRGGSMNVYTGSSRICAS
ncbi:MAG TPA: formate dehydrogenase accessory sulfurtransferase FdhD [Streptosporangiaceae bacterium]